MHHTASLEPNRGQENKSVTETISELFNENGITKSVPEVKQSVYKCYLERDK